MGAKTIVYVKVLTTKRLEPVTEWVEVQAVTLDDAVEEVERLKDVYRVIDVQYDKPEGV